MGGAAGFSRLRLTPGALLDLVRQQAGSGLTKSEVVALTGLSRTLVTQRIDALVAAGFLTPSAPPAVVSPVGTRGRPAERYLVNVRQGVFLVADTGATGMRCAVCDPVGTVLTERYEKLDITDGPTVILGRIRETFAALLVERGLEPSVVLGIGISVPGPVEHGSGRVISPPIMTGWHEFDIPGGFAADYACPVIVENDVNAMATGEHRVFHPDVDDLVFVKIGTGVGTGLVLGGRLYRGADGAAGDIGHTRVNGSDTDAPLCRCGNRGCVEAYAGGWAIIRDLAAAGVDVMTMDGLVNAVRSGNLAALEHVRTAAATVGSAVADLVNTVNPRMVVFGGQLAELDDIVLATVREVIYRRSPPLATRQLVITTTGAEDPGVRGLAVLIADHVFAQERVDQIIARSGIEV